MQGDKSGTTTHHLDEKHPVVGACCVTNSIDCFHNGVQSCVVSNGIIGAIQVVINGSRYSYKWDIKFAAEFSGTLKATVSTYYHASIDAVAHEVTIGFTASFLGTKLFTSGSSEDGTATLNNITYVFG